MSSPPMDALRDAKFRALTVGDTVQLHRYAPGGPVGTVIALLPPGDVEVEWWGCGYHQPQVVEAGELRVSRIGDAR